jgi:hypothetical protein
VSEPDVEVLAHYLTFVGAHFRADAAVNADETVAMIEANAGEGLDDASAAQRIVRYAASRADMLSARPVALDGRMMPAKWLRATGGPVKVDALDHHDDHFFPGCQDIAWDVAATCVEFGFSAGQARHFRHRYRTISGDRSIETRLPLFAIAYLAFRLGYAATAAAALADQPDGRCFAAMTHRYRARLAAWAACIAA